MLNNKISIIVPVYNAEQYIERCIKSILNQKYKNIEIIIVDDASNDSTKVICKKIKNIDSRIKLISKQKNEGVSSARNLGIENATGEFITFVDSDDYVANEIYEVLQRNINDYKCDLSVCGIIKDDKDDKSNIEDIKIIDKDKFYNNVLQNNGAKGYVFNKLFKTDIIKKNNIKFNTNIYICEDLLFVCEYVKFCDRISISTNKLYYYIKNFNSAYHKGFDYKWETVLEAYDKIMEIYSNQSKKNKIFLIYTYTLVVSEVLYRASKGKYYKKDKKKELKKKQYEYLSCILKEKDFNKLLKIKVIIYVLFPDLVGNLKRILKK